jgi:hypothetical protein
MFQIVSDPWICPIIHGPSIVAYDSITAAPRHASPVENMNTTASQRPKRRSHSDLPMKVKQLKA